MNLIRKTSENRWERIWLLAKIEFKLRYYENKLGLIWALLKPLTQIAIYFIAFKIIIRNNIPDFAIYLFSGIIVWQFFVESTGGLISILKTKRYLYEYSNMSKIEIYSASLISSSLGFLFNVSILITILLFSKIGLGFNLFLFPLLFLLLFGFCFGIALILSHLYLLAKDINQVWPLISQFLIWMSPVFFSSEALSSNVPFIRFLNPMFGFIVNFRNILMYNTSPKIDLMLINLTHMILALCLGIFLLKKIGSKASELL